MFAYLPHDTTFMTRIEAGVDSNNIAIQLDIQFGRYVSFDSALSIYRTALGPPSELGTDERAYHQYAEWRRVDLQLRLLGASVTRGKPVTAYLNRRYLSYGARGRQDLGWQVRACEEFSYVFCRDIRE
jgi:hypothetical protein